MIKILSILTSLFCIANAWAIGGIGATCNPNEPDWGSCTIKTVFFVDQVTNTVNVSGGTFTTPYQANQANTRYVLQGDVTANGTAIEISANYVIIDLNGYTITYNETAVGEGVTMGAWNKHHIAVINGSIIQGTAMSEGDQYGCGNNPVTTYNSSTSTDYTTNYAHIANLYVKYGGRDVNGISFRGSHSIFEENTVEDTYEFGTLKNRHQGIDALTGTKNIVASGNIYRYNTIINCRHRGIWVGNNAEVYQNKITTRTIATNGYGIGAYEKQNVKVYNNTVISRGEHPIGIGFVGNGTNNIEIYNNYLDSQTTAIGEEYGGDASCFNPDTPCGNYADGFRTTWGGNNINFHDNEIYITTNSSYNGTYSPDGRSVKVNGKGKGLFVGIQAGETATFENNYIEVLDADGTGEAYGISCTYNFSDALFFINNTIKTNIANIVLGDSYGSCEGFPMFKGNTLIKEGSYSSYHTYSNQYNGYMTSEARIIDSVYSGGAAETSRDFNAAGQGTIKIYFGSYTTDYYYDYDLNDNNGNSQTLIQTDHDPPITLNYANPPSDQPINYKVVNIGGGPQSISIGGGNHTITIGQ